jgi:hypothetical protein
MAHAIVSAIYPMSVAQACNCLDAVVLLVLVAMHMHTCYNHSNVEVMCGV